MLFLCCLLKFRSCIVTGDNAWAAMEGLYMSVQIWDKRIKLLIFCNYYISWVSELTIVVLLMS